VGVWLDGGWGVDACLGQQTRQHEDIDVVVEQRHLDAAVKTLRAAGFGDIPRDDTRAWNFVLGDGRGRLVDFHVIVLADDGRGIYGPPENGDSYPAGSLAWTGTLAGRPVRCISPECLVAFHTGYLADENDWADVRALCDRFGIPVPEDYRNFESGR
jgi:lincosamide nucleotidyltransferase A/C/D/E